MAKQMYPVQCPCGFWNECLIPDMLICGGCKKTFSVRARRG